MPKGDPQQPEHDEIKYIVRIAQTDLDGKKAAQYALTGLKGVGIRTARILTQSANVNPNDIMGYLDDEQVERLRESVTSFRERLPPWMFNYQKSPVTGEDQHLLGSQLDVTLREDLNRMKKTRSYVGIRHERGHKVRGQRTKSTGRRGATVGVQRKKR
ncbi:MAG TPA: 30S ribosomal protein S13 [Candidatus Bathyarchaeia archaeon]|nr:30S ribosomal protein S13 [Candidatus Bathyarchaeia archaeon]